MSLIHIFVIGFRRDIPGLLPDAGEEMYIRDSIIEADDRQRPFARIALRNLVC